MMLQNHGRRASFREDQDHIRKHRPDYLLLVIITLLAAVGLIVVYAISPALGAVYGDNGNHYVSRQMIAVALSIVAFIITANVPLKFWRRWRNPLLIIAGIGTLVALVTPLNALYPAHRWIRLGGLSLQSVEILKFALVVWLAAFFAHRIKQGELTDAKKTLKPLGILLVALMFVVAAPTGLHGQSDLGSVAVILAMMVAIAFVSGMPLKRIVLVGVAIAMLAVLVISISPYRRERVASFTHPNCATTGYQACQALIAVGSGGMIGLGLGRSVQAYGYLPEAQNDSIFAIYAEKFGFIGVAMLIGLFTALFARLRRIMERAPNDFSRLAIAGILAWLSTQTFINIGAMLGLIPLKGITLPLISYGGTSVLFVGAALGLAFQISRYTSFSIRSVKRVDQRINYEDNDGRRRVRRAYHPDSGSRS
ncbi:MAG: putative peptidoglycan glycosyltransferase FtsW [Candidatus Saccharimonadales bacterium]